MLGASRPTHARLRREKRPKYEGTILSRDGNSIKLRGDDDSIGTVDLTDGTKIQLKKGAFIFKRSDKMDLASLVPGLHVEAQGKGNDHGELVAEKVSFDPNSMRASKQIDTRVSPLEARDRYARRPCGYA